MGRSTVLCIAFFALALSSQTVPTVVPHVEAHKNHDPIPVPATITRLDPRFDQLVPRDAKLEKIAEGFAWVEGPVWHKEGGYLLFSDIPTNSVYKWKTVMLRHITRALIDIDPVHAADFQANQDAYLQRLAQVQQELMKRIQRLSDRRFIAHHPAWPYLAKRFSLQIVDTIHTQSGIEPYALHLQQLIAKINSHHIRVIASEIQLSQRLPELLSRDTKARVVVLTTMPGGIPGTDSYLDMLRYNVLQLVGALEST